jgi:hypothetical protein
VAALGAIGQRGPVMFAPALFSEATRNMRAFHALPPADPEPVELIDPNLLSDVRSSAIVNYLLCRSMRVNGTF